MTDAASFTRIAFDVIRGPAAVKAAAYNLSNKLGEFDFTRKSGDYVAGAVLLPDGAADQFADRETLWSAMQEAERQANGQPARQVLVSIPRELDEHLWLDLARAISTPWVEAGMAAQIDVHSPIGSDGERQPHIHFMLSMRRLADVPAHTKAREWNALFREDQGKAERSRIADRANGFFRQHGLAITLDARSLEARGIDRPPEPTAPRQDWQRWLREGALPDQQPSTVQQVFTHREQRNVWERATASADAWAAHAERLEAQEEALREANAAKLNAALEDRARNNQKIIAVPAGKNLAQAAEDTGRMEMARRPTQTARTRSDSWMRATNWDALSDRQREDARRAWERWITQTRRNRERYPLQSYAEYVMDARAREEAARVLDDEPAAVPDAPAIQAAPQTNGISPSSFSAAADSRRTHLEALLAQRYSAPAALASHIQRIEVEQDGRRAVLHTAAGRITDHGDRLEHSGPAEISPQLAAAIVATAAAKGWASGVRLTGGQQYKEAVAMAAAMHRPPLQTDHELSGDGRATVQAQLRERAAAEVAPLGQLTGMAPADAARARVDHEIALAEALMAGEPQGERDPRTIAAARIAEAIGRRNQARQDAAEATAAAAAHREQHPWTARLLDSSARRRQAAMDSEAAALDKEARRLDRSHERSIRHIEKDAEREARQNTRAHQDWKWSKPVRQADAKLRQLDAITTALAAGDEATVRVAAAGKMASAFQAAEQHKVRAEQERADQETARLAARTPAELKAAALAASLAAERAAGSDPRRQEAARTVTAAISLGDRETIEAAANGDMQAAAQAAAVWKRRQTERDEEIRRDLELQAMLRERAEMSTGVRLG